MRLFPCEPVGRTFRMRALDCCLVEREPSSRGPIESGKRFWKQLARGFGERLPHEQRSRVLLRGRLRGPEGREEGLDRGIAAPAAKLVHHGKGGDADNEDERGDAQYCRTENTRSPVSLFRPSRNSSSIRNAMPWSSPPSFLTSCIVACAVPPVASTSSTTSTRWPFSIASSWLSS